MDDRSRQMAVVSPDEARAAVRRGGEPAGAENGLGNAIARARRHGPLADAVAREDERWAPVPTFEGLYEESSLGRLRRGSAR